MWRRAMMGAGLDGGQDLVDHGGGLDAAAARWGGTRADWVDLSTGINPVPYPVADLPADAWTALPDHGAMARLLAAARAFWDVPDGAGIVAAPGASALIARMPFLTQSPRVHIPCPTYNEHARAFRAAGRQVVADDPGAPARVIVHPNNPDGRLTLDPGDAAMTVIDESFCDVTPANTHIARTAKPGTVVLKSFGKFWGLAGLRLGFAIAHPATLAPPGGPGLADMLGPWPVSGPALAIGARALSDPAWANAARARLTGDAVRLDRLMAGRGAVVQGGTPLFRLYRVDDAARWHDRLARARIWSRVFPYSGTWLRLGLPHPDAWPRLEAAI
jgi:cobalamin biosynthesis protein CobC